MLEGSMIYLHKPPPTYCIYHMSITTINQVMTPVEKCVLSTQNIGKALRMYYRQPSGQRRIGLHQFDGTHVWLTHQDIQHLCTRLYEHNQQLLKEINNHV
jgi:hypothetical protein